MRAAPAVEVLLGTGMLERRLIALLHAFAGAVVALWLLLRADLPGIPVAWGMCVVLICAVAAGLLGAWLARRTLPETASRLVWNGRDWRLAGDSSSSAETVLAGLWVSLDLGDWKLLQLQTRVPGQRLWRVVGASNAGPAWHGLRVALQSHGGLPAGEPRQA